MSLLRPLFEKRADSGPTIALSSGDPALANYFGGSGTFTNSSQNVNASTALKISTVYACTNRKALTLAMLPLYTMQKFSDGSHKIAENHRTFKQVNQKPNRWQTSFDWRYMGQVHKMLRGNFYNYIQYNPGRRVNELIPMHPDRVWPFVITPEGTTYYMYDNSPPPSPGSKLFYQHFPLNGNMQIHSADEVFHVRGLSENGIVGKSVIKLMAESVGLAMATEEQGARLFTNGAQIAKVFKHPQRLSDQTFNHLKEQIDEYSGVKNAHRTIILEDGMDIASLSLTMQEAQFLETRKFQVEDICSFLDVPMMLIHRSGDKNQTFASAEVLAQVFVTFNMQPEFRNWEERLQNDLLYDFESNYYFKFDFDELMRGDSKARADYLKSRFATGSLTPNDIKRKEGESPYEFAECDEPYLQSGMMPLKLAGKQNNNIKIAGDNNDTGDTENANVS